MEYNYREAICEDIRTAINDNYETADYTREELEELLNEDLWIDDSVTGNASGSYTFNRWLAEEYLCHNLDLLQEACEEFCCKPDLSNLEGCDVTIRCYLLGECIAAVLDEIYTEE